MKKLLIGTALCTTVVLGAALVQAEVFDPSAGTVTVMASGGTVYEDRAVGPITVTSSGAVVAEVIVPPGRYELIAKAWSDFGVGSSTFAQCGFVDNIADNDNTRLETSGALISSGVEEFTVETTVEYACAVSDDVDIYRVSLRVTTVSAIVEQ